jgi:hypothetical protein
VADLSLAGAKEGVAEFLTSMLRKDEILDTSATFGQAFAIIDDGCGHREPARIQCAHALSFEEYRKLRNALLPTAPHPPSGDGASHFEALRELLWQKVRRQAPTPERKARASNLASLLSLKQTDKRYQRGVDTLKSVKRH